MIIDSDAVRSMDRARSDRPPAVDPPEMLMGTDPPSEIEEGGGPETARNLGPRRRRGRRWPPRYRINDYDEMLGRYVDIYV